MSKSDKRRLMLMGTGSGGASDETRGTFVFEGESHTLGNALRSAVLENPKVMFCGYSIPHPAEDKMFFRIQTSPEYTSQEALKKGLEDLKAMCQITKKTFQDAVEDYQTKLDA